MSTRVDEIGGVPVFYGQGKFKVTVNGVILESTTIEGLKGKVKKMDVPTKVVKWITNVYGGYNEKVEPFEAVATSPKNIYKQGRFGKERVSADSLYYWTPELEAELQGCLDDAHRLRERIKKALSEAKSYP